MTPTKRVFDLVTALGLAVVLLPILLTVGLAVLILDGRPIFYISERMRAPDQPFQLVKFRTMKPSTNNSGVSGGDKASRITRTGEFLRRSRLDELPQLWNVLKGDISFVGPRPPLRLYVEKFPDIYRSVLKSRPGITGLASVYFHKHEEVLLADCKSTEETDAVYSKRCIPRKAKIDLMYQAHQSVCLDIVIMLKTVIKSLR